MSHKSAINKWLALTEKERENICKVAYGSRKVPDKLSGTELDKLTKDVELPQTQTKHHETPEIDLDSYFTPKLPPGWGQF